MEEHADSMVGEHGEDMVRAWWGMVRERAGDEAELGWAGCVLMGLCGGV